MSTGPAFEHRASNNAYRIPARLNLAIIIAQLASLTVLFYCASLAESWWQVALLFAAFAVLGNSIYSVIHEAEHRMLHPNSWVNDCLGAFMALWFPAPYHLIRQGHIGHHQRNRSDDEAFDLYFEDENRILRYLQLYGIVTGMYWVLVAASNFVVIVCPFFLQKRFFEFNRPAAVLMASLNPSYWRLIQIEGLLAIIVHGFVITFFGIPLVVYLIIYFGFGFSWSAMQYVHHFGTVRHVLHGARDLWFFAPIDLLWLNHNWHLTHHERPTVPWIYLPKLASETRESREWLVWHYLKMWRGPRLTDEHVVNKYSGRIIS